MDIFLGEPPANIKQWIIAHHNPGPAGHADTIFTFFGNRTASVNINGTLENLWEYDEDVDNDILVYDGSEKLLKYEFKSIDIGNTVTSIGNSAFLDCSELTSVTIPFSVKSIGSSAFEECWPLTDVTIPNSVESIGASAFNNCVNLTSITFQGKTLAQVQEMNNYPWGISNTSIINVA